MKDKPKKGPNKAKPNYMGATMTPGPKAYVKKVAQGAPNPKKGGKK